MASAPVAASPAAKAPASAPGPAPAASSATGAGSAPAAARAGSRIGRFKLERPLGHGAQATVWLAHDPHLEREVALKLLDGGAGAEAVGEWLNEARAVSRLSHPNIVPVFEADAAPGRPYLVFEYVEGPTLAEARRQRAAWPAREAVTMVLGILDALAAAHDRGIVHRDLKPSNILLGRDGRPRVMDFGIAARVNDGGDGRIVGTAGYMSPEAARGAAPLPMMDVFAAGVMLGELLAGRPLMRESDPWRYVRRIQEEDLELPEDLQLDEVLRGIVMRALARDGGARYDSARAMHTALASWLDPDTVTLDPVPEGASGTLDFLLRRMRHKTDFPALSSSIAGIQRLATSDTANTRALADEILKDVALTHKLLRMVNSAHFASAGAGGITTISRAVALVGFAGIRNMALAVLLMEHMSNQGHAAALKQEFLRALMAGTVASQMAPTPREAEEAFLGSMFQNLGRLLTEYYFPDEAVQIRQKVETRRPGVDAEAAREAAALNLLGIRLEDLGVGVARAWGLPETLQQAMRRPPAAEAPDRAAPRGSEWLSWAGRVANRLTDALLDHDEADHAAALDAIAHAHAGVLGLPPKDIAGAAMGARSRLATTARAMGMSQSRSSAERRLMTEAPPTWVPGTVATAGATPGADFGVASGADATLIVLPDLAAQLAQCLDAARAAWAGGEMRLNELLSMVLQTLHRALGLRAVVLALREPSSGHVVGRFALGELKAAAFRIAVADRNDLFAALLAKGADTLIADAAAVRSRLPRWFREQVDGATFLVLPLVLKGTPIGLVYADRLEPRSLALTDAELGLVRQLRDLLVAAFGKPAA